MAKRSLTPAEQLVGRRLPKEASYRDVLLSGFVGGEGKVRIRFEPQESYLKPAFRKLRQARLIRRVDSFSINGSRPMARYILTELGLPEAKAAKARCDDAREAREAWGRDFVAARQGLKKDPPPTPAEDSPEI